MSYQISFKPSEEVMKEFKPWSDQSQSNLEKSIENTSLELICYCMRDHSSINTSDVIKDITMSLQLLFNLIESEVKVSTYHQWETDDHKVNFYGWEYSKDCDTDKEELLKSHRDTLVLFANVIPTSDWYTDEDKFMKKYHILQTIIESFKEECLSVIDHGIIDTFYEKEVEFEDYQ